VFDQPDAESVAAQYDRIIDALADKLPKVANHLDDAATKGQLGRQKIFDGILDRLETDAS
jgi:Transposase, Mutator family